MKQCFPHIGIVVVVVVIMMIIPSKKMMKGDGEIHNLQSRRNDEEIIVLPHVMQMQITTKYRSYITGES